MKPHLIVCLTMFPLCYPALEEEGEIELMKYSRLIRMIVTMCLVHLCVFVFKSLHVRIYCTQLEL